MRIVVIYVLLALGLPCAATQTATTLFTEANKLYQQENYTEACDLYQQISDSGYYSAELFFNLGNTYYKTGNSPKAILNYERALLFDPHSDDIQFNLDLVKAYSVDKINEIPEFFLKTWITGIGQWFPSNTWSYISVVLFVSALLLLLYFFFGKHIALRKLCFILFLFFIFSSAAAYHYSLEQYKRIFENTAFIVYEPTVTVKGSPSGAGTDLFVIHEGLKVRVLNQYQQWSEIRLDNGSKGWMPSDMLLPIAIR